LSAPPEAMHVHMSKQSECGECVRVHWYNMSKQSGPCHVVGAATGDARAVRVELDRVHRREVVVVRVDARVLLHVPQLDGLVV
jgi:acetamidase/formamidase